MAQSSFSPSVSAAILHSSSNDANLRTGKRPFVKSHVAMCSSSHSKVPEIQNRVDKLVWVWTENKQVMTSALERGWDTFLFHSTDKSIADDWKSIALIRPLFIENSEIFDGKNKKVGVVCQVSSSQQLEIVNPDEVKTQNVVIGFEGEWQVIPAENIVAAFHGCEKTVFAIAKTSDEAQIFFQALERGFGGVVLKSEDVDEVLKLKDYLERRNNTTNILALTTATVTQVKVVGMGDRVCVDLCSLMQPGEGLLIGSFARGLFLVHSECFDSSYIPSRPFRVNAGPVHAYVAIPGGMTCYLSELEAGKEVIVVDRNGLQRTAVVGRIKIESRQLILVEAKEDSESQSHHSLFLQNAETVGLVCPLGENPERRLIPVTSLKARDKILLRLQGGARHTGIEIHEFIVEK
ncbi:3-dehydroquinate synthase II [Zostera marina]|uniref:3-dehydroquinate synthase II n=1 Tax=Zostera marina TaxID=29655 RepID=A0A0K9PGJ9_ZOSMR|nr:3-dehydroquinate synthase II [Zostera marina]